MKMENKKTLQSLQQHLRAHRDCYTFIVDCHNMGEKPSTEVVWGLGVVPDSPVGGFGRYTYLYISQTTGEVYCASEVEKPIHSSASVMWGIDDCNPIGNLSKIDERTDLFCWLNPKLIPQAEYEALAKLANKYPYPYKQTACNSMEVWIKNKNPNQDC
jgi:hypothetical protein